MFSKFEEKMFANPMETDGFEFVEYTSKVPEQLAKDFEKMGFVAVAKHKSKNVTLYRQGQINFILNAEPDSFASEFANQHGSSACAMAFRVKDAEKAFKRALEMGAKPYTQEKTGMDELNVPTIYGIGGSLLYFVDRYNGESIYDIDFVPISGVEKNPIGAGLVYIDHLTHNVKRGQMDTWAGFYERIFNFREIRYFDIKGHYTGLISRALTSPCGKIRIPINESTDEQSQIEEFIHEFSGEGIQHIALATENIYFTVTDLRKRGIKFLDTPTSYYEMLNDRIPWHQEDVKQLQQLQILMDGGKIPEEGLLLQIFTQNMLGPVFFEIIQRKGNEGFGEGNFKALFEAIEREQIRRGVIKNTFK